MAVLAGLLFWWYRRRRWQRQRNARTKSLSDGWLSYPRLWMDEIWLRAHSTRLKPSRKEPSWEIDDDERWLAGRSTVYHDPYSPPGRGQMHELGACPTHTRDASSSTLLSLSHIEFPTVRRVPTFLERFIKFKDGIRKSATYTAKYVSAISPDPTFRIDGSAADSPVAKKFDDHALDEAASHSKPGSDPQPSFHLHRVSTVREEEEDTPGGAPVMVDRTDFEPPRYPAEFPNEGLSAGAGGVKAGGKTKTCCRVADSEYICWHLALERGCVVASWLGRAGGIVRSRRRHADAPLIMLDSSSIEY